ncbi:MAG TPA: response regulator transcription factor [Acidimicrobiales bacterium]|nr:response regulator transcription factor [Acidimicrobiales bacterium]
MSDTTATLLPRPVSGGTTVTAYGVEAPMYRAAGTGVVDRTGLMAEPQVTAVPTIGSPTEPLPPSPGTPPGSARTLRTVHVREGGTSVLAIEDDADIRQLLRALLGREGYVVSEAATGREGLRAFHETRPDLVILDVGLPDLDGWQVLERIRDMSDAPVLVLTARSAERDKVRGLNAGADDYLTKPFSRVELLARLQAIRRRQVTTSPTSTAFDDGRIRLDFVHQQVTLNGEPILLTPTEYRLLSALVRHSGQILSADQLIELAWDDPSGLAPARVKYAVLRLRRKLDWDVPEDSPLETVRGFGYRYRQNQG